MKESEYMRERGELFDTSMKSDHIYQDKIMNRTFHIVSAHLLNFLPFVPADKHDTIFRQIMFHKQLSVLDTRLDDILSKVTHEGLTPEMIHLLQHQPAIICTFHMGSMRLLNHLLFAHNIPFSLVLANPAYDSEGPSFKAHYDEHSKSRVHDRSFNIIAANRPDAGIRMLRELKSGKSLVVYVDGNTGAGKDGFRNENCRKVSFLDRFIYVRGGTAYLSYLTGVPLIPAICYRKTLDEIRIRFHEPVYPDRTVDKHSHSQVALQNMYHLFSVLLKQYPEQWECWNYLHSNIDPNEFQIPDDNYALTEDVSLPHAAVFNSRWFGLFEVGSDYYVFDKRRYKFLPIDFTSYCKLKEASTSGNAIYLASNPLLQNFYRHRVLINS